MLEKKELTELPDPLIRGLISILPTSGLALLMSNIYWKLKKERKSNA